MMRTCFLILFSCLFFNIQAELSESGRILRIAQDCCSRALALKKRSKEQHRLDAISSACLNAHSALQQENRSQAAQELMAVLQMPPLRTTRHLELPMESIIELLEQQELHAHLPPTPAQLSTKRIIFRTFVELFYTFGKSKIELQRETNRIARREEGPDHTEAPTANPLERARHYLYGELIFNRPSLGIRALRILGNEFIDELTPNPDAHPWQEFAELLIPIAIAHFTTFVVLSDTGTPAKKLMDGMAQEMIMRLFVVQFFLKEINLKYIMVMVAIYFLAFYNSSTGNRIWNSMESRENESYFDRRRRYLHDICYHHDGRFNKSNFTGVLVDGMTSLLLYRLIDTGIKKMKLPEWMHLTFVKKEQIPCPEHESEPNVEEDAVS